MTPEERAKEIAAKYRDDPTGADLGLWEPPYLITAAIRAAVAEEREACAKQAEFEHQHGTNGLGIAEAIRLGSRNVNRG